MPPRLFKDAGSSVYAAGGVAFGAQVHAQVISQSGHINFVYVEFTMRTCYELQVYFLQTHTNLCTCSLADSSPGLPQLGGEIRCCLLSDCSELVVSENSSRPPSRLSLPAPR